MAKKSSTDKTTTGTTKKTAAKKTKKKSETMRVKEVGATINLGDYSSLRVTIGEETEFAGLDIGKAQNYLLRVADAVGGILNLPNGEASKATSKPNKEVKVPRVRTYNGGVVLYDNESHQYYSQDGEAYTSVTQFIEQFYPFNAGGVIAQAYMDFASSFGNLIHTAVQNSVIGKPPKKSLVKSVIDEVIPAMKKIGYESADVEQIIEDPSHGIAGRFDIVTYNDDKHHDVVLWDVKTNSNLYAPAICNLPDNIKKQLSQHWNINTIYGEHSLQLNIYAHILENVYGKNVTDIKIIHIPDSFNEIVGVTKVDISDIFNVKMKQDGNQGTA